MNRTGKRGFTLVELLVTMALIALLIGAASLAFTGGTSSTGLKGATLQVRTVLNMARQWAITRREKTYVVFPTTGTNQYRGFNLYSVESGYIREWTLLPKGVIFEKNTTAQGDNLFAAATTRDCGDGNGSMPCLMFKPDGSVVGPKNDTSEVCLYMTEGSAVPTYQPKPGAPVNSVKVYGMTGMVKTQ